MTFLLLVVLAALEGCAGVTVVGTENGVPVGAVTDYTLRGTASRTFTGSSDAVYQATRSALLHMGMNVNTDTRTDDERGVTASAGDREVEIELLALTSKTTQMLVTVRRGLFWRDRATAGEIVAQAQVALDRATALAAQKNGERKNGLRKTAPPPSGPLKSAGMTKGEPIGALKHGEPNGVLKHAEPTGARKSGERRSREAPSSEDVRLYP
jgi:hypothetical protein